MMTSDDENRIACDPSFVRTREKNKEPGSIDRSVKEVRETVRPMMQALKDVIVTSSSKSKKKRRKEENNKKSHQYVTIKECSNYLGIELDEIKKHN